MTPEQMSARLGITVEQLFQDAYKKQGGMYLSASMSCEADLSWMRKWGTIPSYVRKHIAHEERRLAHEATCRD